MGPVYNVIDSDGHILEPLNLWENYIDPAFRERATSSIGSVLWSKERCHEWMAWRSTMRYLRSLPSPRADSGTAPSFVGPRPPPLRTIRSR